MPQGRYFEDLTVSDEFLSARRTVTEADVALFAGISGDYNALHTDEVYAKTTPFGRRIAHGLLVTAISSGLQNQLGVVEGTTLAVKGIKLQFTAPVFPGDTLSCKMVVEDKKDSGRPDRGEVVLRADMINQAGTIVQHMWTNVLLKKKDPERSKPEG